MEQKTNCLLAALKTRRIGNPCDPARPEARVVSFPTMELFGYLSSIPDHWAICIPLCCMFSHFRTLESNHSLLLRNRWAVAKGPRLVAIPRYRPLSLDHSSQIDPNRLESSLLPQMGQSLLRDIVAYTGRDELESDRRSHAPNRQALASSFDSCMFDWPSFPRRHDVLLIGK